ncbi:MAG TPA: recombinase family protein [Gemmataceae bacterium]|jgi:DNA invertase Pin-like site-specific DNA recombinase
MSRKVDRPKSEFKSKPLRFALMPRVSTEKQEQQGESLRTQRKQLTEAVERLGGKIAGWYGGQEHATTGWEREQRDRMLADAEKPNKPVFDAVMVTHEDRWSRDDTRSGADLDRLKVAGVRFFVLTDEKNLNDPTTLMYLGMSAVIGAYHARNQSKKSIENRIERAKNNRPTSGKLPYGRTFNEATGEWFVDPEKRALIQNVAERYLAGESMPKLAKEYGMNHSNLCKLLRERCGTKWPVEFRSDDLGIHETVTLTVPRLLEEKTIKDIKAKLEANRTYLHKPPVPKYEYLLAGHIFCAQCGYALFGQMNPNGRRYYRHAHTERKRDCPLRPRPWVRADAIEQEVIVQLFNLLGNPAAIDRAVKDAIPDCDAALKDRGRLEKDMDRISKARANLLTLIERGALLLEEAEKKLNDLRERREALQDQLDKLSEVLGAYAGQPFLNVVENSGVDADGNAYKMIIIEDEYGNVYAGGNDVQSFLMMTLHDKRQLIESVFSTPLPGGRPAGVYITPAGGSTHGPKTYDYQIRGLFAGGIKGPSGRVMPHALYSPEPDLPAHRSCEALPRPAA